MTTQRIAHPPRATVPETTREQRALKLFEERGQLIERVAPDFYLVPSQDGERFYHVDYRDEVCDCPDHAHRRATCVHIYAVGISVAKRRAKAARCDGCGERFARRELVEVGEEHLALGHAVLEGARYCPPCARKHGVA